MWIVILGALIAKGVLPLSFIIVPFLLNYDKHL